MSKASGHRLIQASGAVVWRPRHEGFDVAVVHRPRYDDWSFPKGKREPGEHPLRTAIREVREEAGLQIVLGRPLGPSVYPVAAGTKHVSYWAARYVKSLGFAVNDEVDDVRWEPSDTARERLTYGRDKQVLSEFRSAPADTVPLIVLRHAAAGSRPATAGEFAAVADLARPLDAEGVAVAQILAGVLACYGLCQVISSAAERCLATVRPYAELVGVQVEVEPAFTLTPDPAYSASLLLARTGPVVTDAPDRLAGGSGVISGSPGEDPEDRVDAGQLEQAARGRTAALARSGVPTLVCAHRENLPIMIDAAFQALGATPPGGEPLGKGEFLVLHSRDGRFVASERHDPEK